jgi:hypothetical protein
VYKRRIVLGGIASATILASGVLAAGTALAVTTPQPPAAHPATTSPLIQSGPISQVPGVAGALQAAVSQPASGAMSAFNDMAGAIPGMSGTTGAVPGPGIVNLAGRGQSKPATRGSAIRKGVTSVPGSTRPANGSLPGLGNAPGAVSNMPGNLGSAISMIPALGGLPGAVPALSQVTQQLGTGF